MGRHVVDEVAHLMVTEREREKEEEGLWFQYLFQGHAPVT
jgi:hypothetical protein